MGLLREQRMRIFQVEGGPNRGQYHHKRILEAVEQRNPEKAREAMRAHLLQVREDSQGQRGAPGAFETHLSKFGANDEWRILVLSVSA